MRTVLRMGSNTPSCLSFTPMAARLAQPVNCRVVFVVDSFMMMVLLSSGSVPLIGMPHHPRFGKSLSVGSTLPLVWAKFRYLTNKYDKDWFGFHFKQFEIAWEKAEEWCIGDPSH